MARPASQRRRRRSVPPAQPIPIPHSSWTETDRVTTAAAPIAAEDFWARLGL